MAAQQYATALSRNPAVAAEGFGSGAKPGIVPAPKGPTMGKAPATGTDTKAGAPVKGFDGALKDGKIRC
jgi:hypothetical protein